MADDLVFGRRCHPLSRRGFLTGLAKMSAVLGATPVFADLMPAGLIPATLVNETKPFRIEGKDPGLIVLNDRPLNAETPPHLLDDDVTPAKRLFVRNNGHPPVDPDRRTWKLRIEGEACTNPQSFTLGQLARKFETVTYQLVLECGGNGRAEFHPPASGNQWTLGAVGCPRWTGVRLADVLKACGVSEKAVYVGYYGADTHLSGKPGKDTISRGVPIAKAMRPESLIAWSLNGEDLPLHNGYPLRLVFGGWPGSTSGKWLKKIVIRDRVHDGAKMGGTAYRLPCHPIAPGETVPESDMCIIEEMPVKSLITAPRTATLHPFDKPLTVRGHAWTGSGKVDRMAISIDFGQTWRQIRISEPVNRHAWQHWEVQLQFPQRGYYEIWARATDDAGHAQPMVVPGWNPKGYLNNACHRIGVRIG
ncbi:sulfite oxidase [Sulfidibacter corallicola]